VKDPARCRAWRTVWHHALLDRRFKYLSTGETRKTLLCQALMSDPELLILDEPFDGLDVQSRAQLAPCWPSLISKDHPGAGAQPLR
jgi:molybdate transport system ATP-binding protein